MAKITGNVSGSALASSIRRSEASLGAAMRRIWELPGLRCEHLIGWVQGSDSASISPVSVPSLCILRRGEAQLLAPQTPGNEPNAAQDAGFFLQDQTLNLVLPGQVPLIWSWQDQDIDLLRIEWTLEAFAAILTDLGPLWQRLEAALEQNEAARLFPEAFSYGLAVHTQVHDLIQHLASPQPQAALHLRGGTTALLAHVANEAFARTQPQAVYVRSDYDRERLHFARTYLLERMAMPPSLPDLARIAGINEFKLKRGFKELFGQPVFAYLAAARLEKARELLLSTTMSATEVAFELGYASLQHFSHAFKQRYGVTPTALRRS